MEEYDMVLYRLRKTEFQKEVITYCEVEVFFPQMFRAFL